MAEGSYRYETSASTSTYHVDRENVSCGGYIGSVIGFVLARVEEDIEEILNEGRSGHGGKRWWDSMWERLVGLRLGG